MKKIECWVSTGYVGSKSKDTIEVPDYYTDDEITKEVNDYLMNFINIGWRELKEPDGKEDDRGKN